MALFNKDGFTTGGRHQIHLAAGDGDVKTVKELLNKGISPDIETRHYSNFTPLHNAGQAGELNTVKLLVERKATIDKTNWYQETAVHVACRKGHVSIVEYLLDHKADINKSNKYSWTPVMTAIYHTRLDVVQLLVERGADLTRQLQDGQTALDVALEEHTIPRLVQSAV